MCSSITQIVFGVIMLTAIALTIGATFSNRWRDIKMAEFPGVVEKIQKEPLEQLQGILPFLCESSKKECPQFWKEMKTYEKVVAACMISALLLEIVAVIWNFVSSCSCCFKKYLIHPLSPLSFLITLILTFAIGVFYYYNDDIKNDEIMKNFLNGNTNVENFKINVIVGSSFWMAVGAWVLVVADTILASLAIFFAEHGV